MTVLALLLAVGYGQPGSKLPTINRADANKETKKLPTIQPPAQPKPANPTHNNAGTAGTKGGSTNNPNVSVNNLIKEYVYDIMTTNGVSLSCSFYGGTRYAVGIKTVSGGIAVLSALPDLFDNKYEYASDCYTLIREITARNAEGQTWEVEKSEYAKEFAPGFIYIPASDITDRSYDIVVPESEHFSGYMVWVFKGKNDNLEYLVTNEEVNFNGDASSAVRQPSVNAIAGILLDDTPNVRLCAVAKNVSGKWELVKVTTSSDQIESDAQKALPQPVLNRREMSFPGWRALGLSHQRRSLLTARRPNPIRRSPERERRRSRSRARTTRTQFRMKRVAVMSAVPMWMRLTSADRM